MLKWMFFCMHQCFIYMHNKRIITKKYVHQCLYTKTSYILVIEYSIVVVSNTFYRCIFHANKVDYYIIIPLLLYIHMMTTVCQ